MNGPDILNFTRELLATAVARHHPPTPEPLNVSPYVAMSALQKAIRRGEEGLALRAAATLHQLDPARLWRRLGVIAPEDVGVADLDTLFLVTSAIAGRTVRARLGGEWPVASYLVSRMARATKCRAADDLLLAAEGHPSLVRQRQEFAVLPTRELIEVATGSGPLPGRALAFWYRPGHGPPALQTPPTSAGRAGRGL
jgi:replication-associated recombination protein RarA